MVAARGLPTPLVAGDAGSRGVGGAGDGHTLCVDKCKTFRQCTQVHCARQKAMLELPTYMYM